MANGPRIHQISAGIFTLTCHYGISRGASCQIVSMNIRQEIVMGNGIVPGARTVGPWYSMKPAMMPGHGRNRMPRVPRCPLCDASDLCIVPDSDDEWVTQCEVCGHQWWRPRVAVTQCAGCQLILTHGNERLHAANFNSSRPVPPLSERVTYAWCDRCYKGDVTNAAST